LTIKIFGYYDSKRGDARGTKEREGEREREIEKRREGSAPFRRREKAEDEAKACSTPVSSSSSLMGVTSAIPQETLEARSEKGSEKEREKGKGKREREKKRRALTAKEKERAKFHCIICITFLRLCLHLFALSYNSPILRFRVFKGEGSTGASEEEKERKEEEERERARQISNALFELHIFVYVCIYLH
jgi:hypothetical protein